MLLCTSCVSFHLRTLTLQDYSQTAALSTLVIVEILPFFLKNNNSSRNSSDCITVEMIQDYQPLLTLTNRPASNTNSVGVINADDIRVVASAVVHSDVVWQQHCLLAMRLFTTKKIPTIVKTRLESQLSKLLLLPVSLPRPWPLLLGFPDHRYFSCLLI